MSATERIDVGAPMPRIAKVVAREGLSIGVTWGAGRLSGTTTVVDLSPLINRLRIFAPLRHRGALFETVHVVEDGAAIAWGDSDAIDVAATTIEKYADADQAASVSAEAS